MPKWEVVYFQSARGEKFVKSFIDEQSLKVKGKYVGMIGFLSEYGPFLTERYIKKIRHDLYEIRITGREQLRVPYTVRGNKIILLHAFKKKTQKVPPKEIQVALSRLMTLNAH